jgi:hypothetical protein
MACLDTIDATVCTSGRRIAKSTITGMPKTVAAEPRSWGDVRLVLGNRVAVSPLMAQMGDEGVELSADSFATLQHPGDVCQRTCALPEPLPCSSLTRGCHF